MRFLVIGHNPEMMKDITSCLRLRWQDGTIVAAAEGSNGFEQLRSEHPDLVIVNSTRRDADVADVVRGIREISDVPMIMIADKENEMNAIRAVEAGADDYVVYPFSPINLLAKVRALLRRASVDGFEAFAPVSKGDLVMNFASREAFLSGQPIGLTSIEYNLLWQLARNEGRVLTHEALLERVWGREYVGSVPLIKDHVCRLRKKLHTGGKESDLIHSVRGVGYKFVRSC